MTNVAMTDKCVPLHQLIDVDDPAVIPRGLSDSFTTVIDIVNQMQNLCIPTCDRLDARFSFVDGGFRHTLPEAEERNVDLLWMRCFPEDMFSYYDVDGRRMNVIVHRPLLNRNDGLPLTVVETDQGVQCVLNNKPGRLQLAPPLLLPSSLVFSWQTRTFLGPTFCTAHDKTLEQMYNELCSFGFECTAASVIVNPDQLQQCLSATFQWRAVYVSFLTNGSNPCGLFVAFSPTDVSEIKPDRILPIGLIRI